MNQHSTGRLDQSQGQQLRGIAPPREPGEHLDVLAMQTSSDKRSLGNVVWMALPLEAVPAGPGVAWGGGKMTRSAPS